MQRYEFTFESVNAKDSLKTLTALVVEPDRLGPRTGVMLCSHGWGNSRYGELARLEAVVDAHDVVGVCVEYRQSGYDSDPVKGRGWDCPYDLSFFQMFDVLNGLRRLLSLRGGLNRRRLFHYGGSQGGHLALLSAAYAPRTFAAVYSSCGCAFVDDHFLEWAGREFLPHELAVRNAMLQAGHIRCPVFLDHGTADKEVPCERHTRAMEQRLRAIGKNVHAVYHEGGDHQLGPRTNRLDALKALAPRFFALENAEEDDFAAGRTVTLECADRRLIVDWSQPPTSSAMFRWER